MEGLRAVEEVEWWWLVMKEVMGKLGAGPKEKGRIVEPNSSTQFSSKERAGNWAFKLKTRLFKVTRGRRMGPKERAENWAPQWEITMPKVKRAGEWAQIERWEDWVHWGKPNSRVRHHIRAMKVHSVEEHTVSTEKRIFIWMLVKRESISWTNFRDRSGHNTRILVKVRMCELPTTQTLVALV